MALKAAGVERIAEIAALEAVLAAVMVVVAVG